MASLSTVYLISVILTSLAGFGSTYMGNKFKGGAEPVPLPVPESVPLQTPPEELPPPSIEQTEPQASSESS